MKTLLVALSVALLMAGCGKQDAHYDSTDFNSTKKAAEQGNALAQCGLGWMYSLGEVIPKDDEEAGKWYLKAAEQGNALAQYNLGYMYQHGEGVPEDDEEAVKWYRKAAEQGTHAGARYNLGYMYQHGDGIPEERRGSRQVVP